MVSMNWTMLLAQSMKKQVATECHWAGSVYTWPGRTQSVTATRPVVYRYNEAPPHSESPVRYLTFGYEKHTPVPNCLQIPTNLQGINSRVQIAHSCRLDYSALAYRVPTSSHAGRSVLPQTSAGASAAARVWRAHLEEVAGGHGEGRVGRHLRRVRVGEGDGRRLVLRRQVVGVRGTPRMQTVQVGAATPGGHTAS